MPWTRGRAGARTSTSAAGRHADHAELQLAHRRPVVAQRQQFSREPASPPPSAVRWRPSSQARIASRRIFRQRAICASAPRRPGRCAQRSGAANAARCRHGARASRPTPHSCTIRLRARHRRTPARRGSCRASGGRRRQLAVRREDAHAVVGPARWAAAGRWSSDRLVQRAKAAICASLKAGGVVHHGQRVARSARREDVGCVNLRVRARGSSGSVFASWARDAAFDLRRRSVTKLRRSVFARAGRRRTAAPGTRPRRAPPACGSSAVASTPRALDPEEHAAGQCLPAAAGRQVGSSAAQHRIALRLVARADGRHMLASRRPSRMTSCTTRWLKPGCAGRPPAWPAAALGRSPFGRDHSRRRSPAPAFWRKSRGRSAVARRNCQRRRRARHRTRSP